MRLAFLCEHVSSCVIISGQFYRRCESIDDFNEQFLLNTSTQPYISMKIEVFFSYFPVFSNRTKIAVFSFVNVHLRAD